MHVPERFRKALLLHLFKNLHPAPAPATPLILGIHGPSGEGKTYQAQAVLDEIKAHIEFISGGELESRDAGEPAELIRAGYRSAASYRVAEGGKRQPAVLFVNDIDAAIGDWGEQVQYTVNRQNVFGELMHLTDFPETVERQPLPRVPIVVTGNDFTKLYGPLLRLGRMHLFTWTPTDQEKLAVVERLYPELTRADCAALLKDFPGQPVTFYAQLRDRLHDDLLWSYLEQAGSAEAFDALGAGRAPRLPGGIDFGRLRHAGTALLESRVVANHLEG
jgi:SpoVK/Ycf46/Vps4 family AAA+-type ATPase